MLEWHEFLQQMRQNGPEKGGITGIRGFADDLLECRHGVELKKHKPNPKDIVRRPGSSIFPKIDTISVTALSYYKTMIKTRSNANRIRGDVGQNSSERIDDGFPHVLAQFGVKKQPIHDGIQLVGLLSDPFLRVISKITAAYANSFHDGGHNRGVLAVLAGSGENEVRQRALKLAGLSNVLRMREEETWKRGSRRR